MLNYIVTTNLKEVIIQWMVTADSIQQATLCAKYDCKQKGAILVYVKGIKHT